MGLSLAAKNKSGVDTADNSREVETGDVVASFSLIGNIIGIMVVIAGLFLAGFNKFTGKFVAPVCLLCSVGLMNKDTIA